MNPIKASLKYPTVTLVLTAMMVFVGLHAFLKMPRTEDPTITIRTGLVIALYPGATSLQVEKQVTKVLERHIFKFQEVRKDKTYSTSRPGLVIVNVELEDNVKDSDKFWSKLRHEMNETKATELPDGVQGPIVNSDFGDTVAMLIAVHGKRYGYRELRDYVDKMQDEMRTIREVGKLATYGNQSEQIWITGSTQRISQYLTDPGKIIQALRQRNIITSSGHFEAEQAKVPLRTTGAFSTEDQIGSLLVDVSKSGQPVYIRDFAKVERRYQDPTFLVRYDGEPSLLLSVEMQKGKNIVELGERLDSVLGRLKTMFPPDVQVDLVANQPEVVKERITSLSHEFLLAIISVVLVTMLLLPLRVAVIAALAIPVTLCTTMGAMNALGITLHQVSIAALIMVLGIVVDDAIVIADNYVELLDRKVSIAEAAWHCATDMVVPVLTATVTIICSFLPLLIITGSSGEFIRDLPLTVAIALAVSFIVAMFLTPIMCRFFIKKGLHSEDGDQAKKKKFSLLDWLQGWYNKAILFFLARKPLALLIGVCGFAAGIFLFSFVHQQFFPSAERNQFVVDVWTPQGSRIEMTDSVMRRIEGYLRSRKDITHFATFVGQSAPRFYYNVNPQQPDGAYGQFIVNTVSAEETPRLVGEMRESLARLTPEALVIVKELQQGSQLEAPVEIRIFGDDIEELTRLGEQVQSILHSIPSAELVHQDYFNDSFTVDVNVNTELSNRLGLTDASASQALSGGFDGAQVNTYWEGDRAVNIMLRLDPADRSSYADIGNTYLTSQLTQARVPVRSVATLAPDWQTSRLVRRNGVRCLTVRAFVKRGHYASEILKEAGPRINALPLPEGYRIEYGGEYFNQQQTFPQMIVALGISLVAIFLVLLIQFRNLPEPLIVMSSIPLALPGAVLGLVLTGNPFGFTAFMGMISLCGIVVRNSIILVDYIKERMAEGAPLEQAAAEAGERRLRPIFLTTMAAAVGVTPMILSGSSLWSPLASVIAIGLIMSMFFTLLVVPVLYVVVKSRAMKPAAVAAAIIAVILLGGAGQASAETLKITLPEAVGLALKQNRALKIGQAKVTESIQKVNYARADYFPKLSNESRVTVLSDKELVTIPRGSLGTIPGLGPFPVRETHLNQGSSSLVVSETTLAQPLTQLLKIHQAKEMAENDRKMEEANVLNTENDVELAVHQYYYGLLVALKQKDATEAGVAAAKAAVTESEEGLRSGNALEVAVIGSKADLLQKEQSLIAAETDVSDQNSELDDLLGLPTDTELEPSDVAVPDAPLSAREDYLKIAYSANPELRAAREGVEKSHHGINAAHDAYIPDVTLFAKHIYQDGAPFLTHNVGVFGATLTWDIFDWGKRKAVIGEREAQLLQADENSERIESRIQVNVDKALRKLQKTRQMMEVSQEALALRRENERLSSNQLKAGTITDAKYLEVVAAVKEAETDELAASLNHQLALRELDRAVGTLAQ